MYAQPGADGYISHVALTRRLRFVPDHWEKGFSRQVQAWGSRAHFMQVRVLFFMRHWWQRWKVTIRKVQYVTTPKGGYIIAPDANADWADEQLAKCRAGSPKAQSRTQSQPWQHSRCWEWLETNQLF